MKPYYEDDLVTLRHGDCLDVLRSLSDGSVDAVVTDPPYNLSFMAKPWDAHGGQEDAGFAYWLAGLIDGEGHFAIKRHTRGTHAPHFTLKMRADEAGTLEMIQRKFGHGTIQKDSGTNPMLRWTLGDKAACQALVELLDKYPLRAKKMVDFWTWREAVIEWTNRPRGNRWHGAANNDRMAALRDRLMETRKFNEVAWSGNEFQDWCRLWATECLRVLKPGGHLLAFGGSRTWHRLAAAIEDGGFEIRDSIAWLYGSGFPKSMDVSKAIDKAQGATGTYGAPKSAAHAGWIDRGRMRGEEGDEGWQRPWMADEQAVDNAARKYEPSSPEAQAYKGWGTALKPAFEPVVIGRKPLAVTVAANVLAHGTGALNIDGCRIEGDDAPEGRLRHGGGSARSNSMGGGPLDPAVRPASPAGRWPANVVLDESQAGVLDEQSGELTSGLMRAGTRPKGDRETYGKDAADGYETARDAPGDSGGASRFFYVAKAGADERPRVDGVAHPTVKPLELMRWLIRLVTPPGGVVLEPFAGSGTTVEACIIEGFRVVAVEREAEYLPLVEARIARRRDPVRAIELAGEDAGLFGLIDDGGDAA
ncbi:DNA methyltransferase [Pimelobacter simplex]|uniref:DNA methyltransferase n=1 Tax=Nocardioides simplex TaxID=2045 RepID=UPI00367037A2